jgi:hypothetical protein
LLYAKDVGQIILCYERHQVFGLREDKELMPLDLAVRMVWDKRTRVCKYLQRHVKEFKESHILLPEDKQFCNLFPILKVVGIEK